MQEAAGADRDLGTGREGRRWASGWLDAVDQGPATRHVFGLSCLHPAPFPPRATRQAAKLPIVALSLQSQNRWAEPFPAETRFVA